MPHAAISTWSPRDGHSVQRELVGVGVRAGARGEDDPGDEAWSEGVAELGETAKVGAGGPLVGLDLEGEDGAVLVLNDQVHLGAVAGPPVAQGDGG